MCICGNQNFLLLLYLDLDAEGKPGAGIELGNMNMVGSYQECINIKNAHYCSMLNVLVLGKVCFQYFNDNVMIT